MILVNFSLFLIYLLNLFIINFSRFLQLFVYFNVLLIFKLIVYILYYPILLPLAALILVIVFLTFSNNGFKTTFFLSNNRFGLLELIDTFIVFYCKDFFVKLFGYRSKVAAGLINKFSSKTLETFNYNHNFNNNQFIKNLCFVTSVLIFLYFF